MSCEFEYSPLIVLTDIFLSLIPKPIFKHSLTGVLSKKLMTEIEFEYSPFIVLTDVLLSLIVLLSHSLTDEILSLIPKPIFKNSPNTSSIVGLCSGSLSQHLL